SPSSTDEGSPPEHFFLMCSPMPEIQGAGQGHTRNHDANPHEPSKDNNYRSSYSFPDRWRFRWLRNVGEDQVCGSRFSSVLLDQPSPLPVQHDSETIAPFVTEPSAGAAVCKFAARTADADDIGGFSLGHQGTARKATGGGSLRPAAPSASRGRTPSSAAAA